jgi:hypothetical protein
MPRPHSQRQEESGANKKGMVAHPRVLTQRTPVLCGGDIIAFSRRPSLLEQQLSSLEQQPSSLEQQLSSLEQQPSSLEQQLSSLEQQPSSLVLLQQLSLQLP